MAFTECKLRMPKVKVEGFVLDEAPENLRTLENLDLLGVSFNQSSEGVKYVMDSMPTQGVTNPTAQVPVQFLQHWMNKIITVVTQATTADEFLGRSTYGEWYQESVVLRLRELTGSVRPYGDHAQAPLARYNYNQEDRTIVRFAQGILTGALEEARLAAMGQKASAYESDRAALGLAFKLNTNAVAFFGYNLGYNKTYGILNDPNLAPYQQVPAVGGETQWSKKDFYQIVTDLNVAVAELQKQCAGNFIPSKHAFKIGIALSCDQFLNQVNQYGISVRQYIANTWPKAELVVIPEFDGALAGDNVFYLKLEELAGNPVVEQIVPAAVRLVGSVPRASGLYELYTDATAGCFVEQPLGIVRFFGI
jgi:hypothetical protein